MDYFLFSLTAMTVQIAGSSCQFCLAEGPPLQIGSKKRRDYGGKRIKRPIKIGLK
jgi:hypothetical protein